MRTRLISTARVHVCASHFQIKNSNQLLFSAIADIATASSAFSFVRFLSSSGIALSLAGATIRPSPSIRPVDGGCQTQQMAAERVTEARVTDVCLYARKRDARKLLVLAHCDWICRWACDVAFEVSHPSLLLINLGKSRAH
jgi:hypothetical protein